jgi:hypothetical protein
MQYFVRTWFTVVSFLIPLLPTYATAQDQGVFVHIYEKPLGFDSKLNALSFGVNNPVCPEACDPPQFPEWEAELPKDFRWADPTKLKSQILDDVFQRKPIVSTYSPKLHIDPATIAKILENAENNYGVSNPILLFWDSADAPGPSTIGGGGSGTSGDDIDIKPSRPKSPCGDIPCPPPPEPPPMPPVCPPPCITF